MHSLPYLRRWLWLHQNNITGGINWLLNRVEIALNFTKQL
jgi:hypothetical protein